MNTGLTLVDGQQLVREHAACRSLPWAPLCEWLLAARAAPPTRGGVDAGDHPPITPTRAAPRGAIRGGTSAWALYCEVCKHYVASLLPPATYDERTLVAAAGGSRLAT